MILAQLATADEAMKNWLGSRHLSSADFDVRLWGLRMVLFSPKFIQRTGHCWCLHRASA